MNLDISTYIKELIIRNECIILSGFGGFETHYKPASVDTISGKLIPPTKQVIFRPEFRNDNGVLIQFVAGKEKLSTEEARKVVYDFIRELTQKIEEEGTCELKGIGSFVKQAEGSIVFNPLEHENYLIDSFGLSEIKMSKIAETATEPPVMAQEVNQPVVKRRSFVPLYMIAILITIISGLIILAVKSDLFNNSGQRAGEGSNRGKRQSDKIVFGHRRNLSYKKQASDTLNQKIDELTEKENALYYKEPREKSAEKEKITGFYVPGNDKRYLIVAGSFQDKKYATGLYEKLCNEGFQAEIVRTSNGLYRVILDACEEINTAIDEMEKYRKQLHEDLWILRI